MMMIMFKRFFLSINSQGPENFIAVKINRERKGFLIMVLTISGQAMDKNWTSSLIY